MASERLGHLHGERPHASGRADDQHALPRPNPSSIAKGLKRGGAGGGNRRRLLEGEVRRLWGDLVHSSGRELGECAVARSEHIIARPKPRDALADRLDAARDILAPNANLRRAEPRDHAKHQREAGHDVPVADEDARREDPNEYLPVTHHRCIDVFESQDIR